MTDLEKKDNQHNRIKRFLFFNEMKSWGGKNSIDFLFTIYKIESEVKTKVTDEYEPSVGYAVKILCDEIIYRIEIDFDYKYPKELIRKYKLYDILPR